MQNVTKILVDRLKLSKYFIAKHLGVSWNTVHFWYKNVYTPSKERQGDLDEMLKKNNTNKK